MTLLNLIQKDEELSRSVRVLEGHKWIKPFAVVFAHSGDSWFWLAGLILVVIFGEQDLEDLGIDPEWKHPGPGSICPFP